ncbi:conserved hypothetical protein [Candidatus Zixiibacteriota bacterium]|nr:conserved hypothetical protein [candidate division Zixibacteria bacterium]
MSCIFCGIIKREKPAKIHFEDDTLIVFADILPRAALHLLICPKSHFLTLLDTPDEILLAILDRARTIARELGIEDNFRLVLNNGAKSGQIVEHLHFHFMSNAPHLESSSRR